MANPVALELLSLTTRTGNVTGGIVDLDTSTGGVIRLNAVISQGTGTITFRLEDSTDQTTWATVTTGSGTEGQTLSLVSLSSRRYLRVIVTASGTHVVSVSGTVDQVYATKNDVAALGVQALATASVAADIWAAALLAATAEAASYLGACYSLPLLSWGFDVRQNTARLAALAIISARGFQPGGPDEILVVNAKAARDWFMAVARGTLAPEAIEDSTPDDVEGAFAVFSDPPRGWGVS